MNDTANNDLTTIEKNYEQLDPASQQYLVVCSFLAMNTPIPIDLISIVVDNENKDEVFTRLQQMTELQLLEKMNDGFLIQPNVATFVQSKYDSKKLKEILGITAKGMETICKSMNSPGELAPYVKHADVLAQKTQLNKLAVSGFLSGYLGNYWLSEGDIKEAVVFYRRALLIIEKFSGVDSAEYTEHLNNLGSALHKTKKLEEAKHCFEQVVITDKKVLGKDHPAVAIGLNNLGQVLLELNNIDGAVLHLENALDINTRHYGLNHPLVASGLYNFGMALFDVGDLEKAKGELTQALAIRQNIYGDQHPIVAESHHGLGMVFQTLGNIADAETNYLKAIKIWENDKKQENIQLAASYTNLGGILHVKGAFSDAKENYLKGLEIFEACLPANDKNIRDLQLQIKLLDHKISMPELLEKMESGEELSQELILLLDEIFGEESKGK
jgi:tetratricopeptide (TPR) repeat protein